ncbi:MAG: type I-E CRISPR-associated protein Cse2/CasB [Proteobacteria bacterium]|nr:type I-E CRISPR-associated protein Cse2/CasB [Pseudomonadota bacterium]
MIQKKHPLVEYLEKIRDRDDRATMAKLRRGLGKRMGTPDMYPYVVNFLPKSLWMQEHCFLVAALFALHPERAPLGRNMGAVFKVIQRLDPTDSIEKRFIRLLNADSDDMGYHLKQAVSLAKSKGVTIDYHRLIADLTNWNHEDRFVQLAWAKEYWKEQQETTHNETQEGDQA